MKHDIFVNPKPKPRGPGGKTKSLITTELMKGPASVPELALKLRMNTATIYTHIRELLYDERIHFFDIVKSENNKTHGTKRYAMGPMPPNHKARLRVKDHRPVEPNHLLSVAGMLGVTKQELEKMNEEL